MTPIGRIKRIQRWVKLNRESPWECSVVSVFEVHDIKPFRNQSTWARRMLVVSRLFAAELDWLCRYTLAIKAAVETLAS